jgi:hypothetical protein
MNRWRNTALAVTMLTALAACDRNNGPQLVTDAEITADIATSAGDAMALAVANLVSNEADANLSIAQAPGSSVGTGAITYSATRKCYDANGDIVTNCQPVASVRKIVTQLQLDGTRSGSDEENGATWSGAVHRALNDTLTRVFVTGNETQRVHAAIGTAHDTLTFESTARGKFFSENATDSVKAVTFNLPRGSNPYPVSGSLVRNVAVHVIVTKGAQTDTRDVTKRIEVTFPADAQGNVQLTINATTCNLNLVTHKVTNCN